jgi:hypothetical protein
VNSGTAVYATTSGTATFATNSGTAVYSTNSGTAVFATNASTAVTISGSIAQSQVTNLTTDLAGKANLAGGNAFTGAQTVTGTAIGSIVATVTGASGQNTDIFRITNSTPTTLFAVSQFGRTNISGSTFITPTGASEVVATVRGASGQTADLLQLQNSSGTILSLVNSSGSFRVASIGAIAAGNAALTPGGDTNGFLLATVNAGNKGLAIRGASSQSADLLQLQDSASTNLLVVTPTGTLRSAGLITAGSSTDVLGQLSVITTVNSRVGAVVRGASGQTANLFEARDSANNPVAWISSAGTFVSSQSTGFSIIGAASFGSLNAGQTVRLQAGSGVAANAQVVVRGVAGATGHLLQLQDSSGTVLSGVSASGRIYTGTAPLTNSGAQAANISALADAATVTPLIVRGAASQSADYFQVQNSSGAVVAKVDSIGDITARVLRSQLAARIATNDVNVAPMVVSTISGQVSNNTEWQNNTGVVASVAANGVIRGAEVRTNNTTAVMREVASGGNLYLVRATSLPSNPGANVGTLYFRDGTNAGTLKLCVRAGAAGAETTILDNIPQ